MNDGSTAFLNGAVWASCLHLRGACAPPRRGRTAAAPCRPARLDQSQIAAEARVLREVLRERTHDRQRLLQMAARLLALTLRAGCYRQL